MFPIMVRREGGVGAGWKRRALRWSLGVALAVLGVAAAAPWASAHDTGPFLPFTGAPQEPITGDGATCNYPGGCHDTFDVDSGPGSLTIEAPPSYEPGMTYPITVDLSQEGQLRWGFQMTALDELLQGAGTFAPSDANTQRQAAFDIVTDRRYISHTEPGTAAGQANGNSWTFQWIAPETDVGPVTLYAAGNAADNSDTSTGSNDYIYTTTATISAPEPGALAAGLLALSTAAILARRP
jgi:hypothetical protein